MELFSIQCTTCGQRLKVRNLAAIGQILSCPKCQSFVEVKAPAGWVPPKPEPPAPTPDQAAQAAQTAASDAPGAKPEWQQPFGFEHGQRPAWQKTALIAGGAAALILILALAFWPSDETPVVENVPPVDAGEKKDPPKDPAKADPEKKPEADPPKVDPAKKPDPEKTPDVTKKVDPPKADPEKLDPTKKLDPPKTPVEPDPTKKPDPEPKNDPESTPKKDPEPVKPIIEPIKPERPIPAANPGLPLAEVESRLATPIESIQAPPKLMLTDAIDALAQIANLKISLDVEALAQSGVSADDPVTFDMSKTTVSDVLERVLEQRGLVYVIEAGQLRVTSRKEDRDVFRERAHEVGDLTKGDPAAAKQLATLIQTVVDPGGWQQRPIVVGERQLTVNHNEWVHRRVGNLLARLRMARGLTPQTPAGVDAALASRVSRASPRLAKALTVNLPETPLSRAVTTLSARADCKILIDTIALDAAGISADSKATAQSKQPQSLEQILTAMLGPLELSYRIIDEKTLQITSRQAASETIDLELYKARDLAATPALAAALIERIEREVTPGTWHSALAPAGEPRPKVLGGLAYDPLSGYLIVSHVQPVQALVEDLLDTIRRPAQAAPVGEAPKK